MKSGLGGHSPLGSRQTGATFCPDPGALEQLGLGFWGLGFRVFGFWGLGFGILGLGFGVWRVLKGTVKASQGDAGLSDFSNLAPFFGFSLLPPSPKEFGMVLSNTSVLKRCGGSECTENLRNEMRHEHFAASLLQPQV